MATYFLPDLPYAPNALEPHLSARIIELHHGKHHKKYVESANETLEKLEAAREHNDFEQLAGLERSLAFNVSGHVLHSIFWQNMSPDGGGTPQGALAEGISRDFGSFAALKGQMNAVAASIMGSGWAALVFEPLARRLAVQALHDHQSDTSQGSMPLLVIDAWEHAYYLQYQTEKAKYFEALWNVWNWADVAKRYQGAQEVNFGLARPRPSEPPPRAVGSRRSAH